VILGVQQNAYHRPIVCLRGVQGIVVFYAIGKFDRMSLVLTGFTRTSSVQASEFECVATSVGFIDATRRLISEGMM
jgi:hypothetical protein